MLRAGAFVCAAGAIGMVAFARPHDAVPGDASLATASLQTPLWSLRRAPALIAHEAARASTKAQLAAIVAPYDGCVAVDDGTGPVARVHTDRALAPASNLKLLTAAAALKILGPSYRLTTRALTTAPLRNDGTLAGDLVIVGGGDPVVVSRGGPNPSRTLLDDLARDIAAAGIEHITGAVTVDDTRYDDQRLLPDWKSNYVSEGDVGPIGALSVDGGFPPVPHEGGPDDPALLTGNALVTALRAHGVTTTGAVYHAQAPNGARTIAHLESPTVGQLVASMLTESNNYTAEMLTREMGYVRAHEGSAAAGTREILGALQSLGVPVSGLVLHDGSGLAPDDRATCDALLSVIDVSSRPGFDAIDKGLPIAGRTGTLAPRFRGDPLAGALRAKTGSISGVVALTGTVDNAVHPRFSFIANGAFTEAAGQQLQERIAHAVAAYPSANAAGGIVPPP